MQNQSVEVRLLGQRILLRSQESSEFTREVVDFVTTKLTEVEQRSKNVAPHQVALLALLDLAEEYLKAKRRAQEHRSKMDEKSKELLSLIEMESR